MQGAIAIEQNEIVMRRALRGQVLGQRIPLATRRQHVEDCIDDFANIDLTSSPTAPRRRHEGHDKSPFRFGQITRIAKPATVRRAAVFGCPHGGALLDESHALHGITNDSADSTSFRIGSYITLNRCT